MSKRKSVAAWEVLVQMKEGTVIRSGQRKFVRTATGTFWREIDEVPGNCVSRPSASVWGIIDKEGGRYEVVSS